MSKVLLGEAKRGLILGDGKRKGRSVGTHMGGKRDAREDWEKEQTEERA